MWKYISWHLHAQITPTSNLWLQPVPPLNAISVCGQSIRLLSVPVQFKSSKFIRPYPFPKLLIDIAPMNPICLQTTFASSMSKLALQTVPHTPLCKTSILPSCLPCLPATSWIVPMYIFKTKWYYVRLWEKNEIISQKHKLSIQTWHDITCCCTISTSKYVWPISVKITILTIHYVSVERICNAVFGIFASILTSQLVFDTNVVNYILLSIAIPTIPIESCCKSAKT